MVDMSILPKPIQQSFSNLFLTVQSTIKFADPVSEHESLINNDILNDLKSAYQDVYEMLNSGD